LGKNGERADIGFSAPEHSRRQPEQPLSQGLNAFESFLGSLFRKILTEAAQEIQQFPDSTVVLLMTVQNLFLRILEGRDGLVDTDQALFLKLESGHGSGIGAS